MQPRWRVVPGSSFRWRHWDDESVLYHGESGDTHRLNPVGARALEHLARGPMTADSLGRQLSAEFGLVADADFPATIARLLARFYDLGLVEPLDDSRQPEPDRSR